VALCMLQDFPMTQRSVVLLGSLPTETPEIKSLAEEFGWRLDTAADLDQLRSLIAVRNPVAILLDPNDLGLSWDAALNSVQEIDSRPYLILCHRFSDVVDWPKLAEAGAFHALARPLDPNEVRQSLAFVWSAALRSTANILPMHRPQGREAAANVHEPTLIAARSRVR
jgi:DNA-binding NtrC family response regulator